MLGLVVRKLVRRCSLCRAEVQGEGVRRGLRVFCSPLHLQRFVEEDEARKRALSRMVNRKGGGCC